MAGEVKLELQNENVVITNYGRSKQLRKFLDETDLVPTSGNGPIEVTPGDAHRLLRRLRDGKSSLAPRLSGLLRELENVRRARKEVARIDDTPLDKYGVFLSRGCNVKCTWSDHPVIKNITLYGTFEGVTPKGWAIVCEVFKLQFLRPTDELEKRYVLYPPLSPPIGHVPFEDIEYVPEDLRAIKSRYYGFDRKSRRGPVVIKPVPETSNMLRKEKRRRKKRTVKLKVALPD